MSRWMIFVCLALTGMTLLFLTGCEENGFETNGSNTPDDSGVSYLRFIHSAVGAGIIDFAYHDFDTFEYTNFIAETVYGRQYGYYGFTPGSRNFRAYLAGTNIVVSYATVDLVDQIYYSVIMTNQDAAINPSLIVLTDTSATADVGKVLIRFLHASADAPTMDLMNPDDTALVTGLAQYANTGYLELDAGTYDFYALSTAGGDSLPSLETLTLLSGVNYTAIFSGSTNGLPGPVFNLKLYQETDTVMLNGEEPF